jgi:CubicO group peptidase (beta-lactamase class C family)
MSTNAIPDWVTYPEEDWVTLTPARAGLDVEKFRRFLAEREVKGAAFGGEDHEENRWGAVLTRGGYLVHAWGDRNYRFQTASLGKAFMWVLLGFAVEEGRVDSDAPIHETWTGEGQLSHPHKYLNQGHHRKLTWRHILGSREDNKHYGGFPIEIGHHWQKGRTAFSEEEADRWIPRWAKWTGDPFFDNYSHAEPGTVGHYSSGGFWRLGQALTALWDRDLKGVLDERLFGKIGIPPDRWDWLTGRAVSENKYFYPTIPDSYTYLDPPYEINGHAVRSGPGWVVMSASDIARFGHLVATRGVWKGERLIDPQWLRGHGGGNGSGVSGEGHHYTAMGVVTTQGINHPHSLATTSFLPDDLFVGPVQVTGVAL